MHWHNGSTCHGFPTVEECVQYAIDSNTTGRILERNDVNESGKEVSCYSLVVMYYDHYAKQGRFVAEVKLAVEYFR